MKTLWYTLSGEECVARLNSGKDGLSSDEAAKRLAADGPNKLIEGKRKTMLGIFFAQFTDLMIWVLMAAAAVSFIFNHITDGVIILTVVLLNAVLGTVQESRAESALDALNKMSAPFAKVYRDGSLAKIPASEIVTGDIVAIEAGDSVPADMRLLESASIKAEESALTGESLPDEKFADLILGGDAPIGDRDNMLHMGTSVTYGRGTGVVVACGMATLMGGIADQLGSTKNELTPLQKQLNKISTVLSIGVLIIAAIIFCIGMLYGTDLLTNIMTAVSLAVAAIPEGLVAVVTIVLAMGMSRMAGRGAIIRRLPAVETLGSTQIICSDKTGTLTLNRMTVKKFWLQSESDTSDDARFEPLVQAMGHCNDSKLDEKGGAIGDPTETALIDYVLAHNNWSADQIRGRIRAGEIPFDSERKLSTVVVSRDGGYRIYVKGAPDVLLSRCSGLTPQELAAAEAANADMAGQALRVLAFGYKDSTSADVSDIASTERDLTFCGLVGMIDPPRPEARDAVAACRSAGILPVMITGDHKITAVAIADSLGMLSDGRGALSGAELEALTDEQLDAKIADIGVYARVAPEHKTRIVRTWQKKGKIVSMTGDGVNDAPSLKAADIGVGMGITGTDVSKGASDMVLTDDNFATIVSAVGEGRRIFDNIHKTVSFLLSSNLGEVLAILIATLSGFTLLGATHILWVNLVTDTFPALALGSEPAESDVMERPPRDSRRPILSFSDWMRVLFIGAVEAALCLAAYWFGSQTDAKTGTTMAFITLAFLQLFACIGFQSERHSILKLAPTKHPILWLALFGSAALQMVVLFVPFLRDAFNLTLLSGAQWGEIGLLCLAMLIVIEVQKLIIRFTHKSRENESAR